MDTKDLVFSVVIIVIIIAGIIATIYLPETTTPDGGLRESIDHEIVRSPEGRSTQASPKLDFVFWFCGDNEEEVQLNKRYFYCAIVIGALIVLFFVALIVRFYWD